MPVGHASDAGDKRCERPHDGHEAGEDDGLAAMAGVEVVGLVEILAAENARVGIGKQLHAEEMADGVIDGVSQYGGEDQQCHQQVDVHFAHGRNGTGNKQERVARQERRDDQAGFGKHDQEQDQVDPGAVGGNQLEQMLVDVQHEVDDEADEFHGIAVVDLKTGKQPDGPALTLYEKSGRVPAAREARAAGGFTPRLPAWV